MARLQGDTLDTRLSYEELEGLTNKELNKRVREIGRATLHFRERFRGLLCLSNEREAFRDDGYASVCQQAAERGGETNVHVRYLLYYDKKLKGKRKLRKLLRTGLVGWTYFKVLGNLVHEVAEDVLVNVLQKLNKRALEAWCKDMRRKLGEQERQACERATSQQAPQSETTEKVQPVKQTIGTNRTTKGTDEDEAEEPPELCENIEMVAVRLRPRTSEKLQRYKKHAESEEGKPLTISETIDKAIEAAFGGTSAKDGGKAVLIEVVHRREPGATAYTRTRSGPVRVDDEELANRVCERTVIYLEDERQKCKELLETLHAASPSGERPIPSRYMPTLIRRYIWYRDGGHCVFPGCNAVGNELHHILRYGQGHYHDPDRIFTLCESHERLMHAGLVENEGDSPEQWRVCGKRETTCYDDAIRDRIDEKTHAFRTPNRDAPAPVKHGANKSEDKAQ